MYQVECRPINTMSDVLFGLDLGTTKICAIVGEVRDGELYVIGHATEPSRGMKRGMVVDVKEASRAIERAVEKAELSADFQLTHAFVSMAGDHLRSHNARGFVTVHNRDTIQRIEVERALGSAMGNQTIPADRETVHIVPRAYKVDDEPITTPIGMYGNRLEVEAHIVTASSLALKNLQKCTADIGLRTEDFILNTLASAETVLSPSERQVGVLVADIGGGTTDIALYKDGTVWHTDVIPIGGEYFTSDISIGLRVPVETAERIKLQFANCRPDNINPDTTFQIKPFSGERIEVGLQDLAYVTQARAEELFDYILKSIEGSGYDGLIPAGIVMTGGGSQLRNLREVAERKLRFSARVARPTDVKGLSPRMQNPKYSTAVGLLMFAMTGENTWRPNYSQPRRPLMNPFTAISKIGKVFLPG